MTDVYWQEHFIYRITNGPKAQIITKDIKIWICKKRTWNFYVENINGSIFKSIFSCFVRVQSDWG